MLWGLRVYMLAYPEIVLTLLTNLQGVAAQVVVSFPKLGFRVQGLGFRVSQNWGVLLWGFLK